MTSISIISPKAFFIKIADVFQKSTATAPPLPIMAKKEEEEVYPSPTSKMNVTLQDLKTISTALLHYRRSLARLGEEDRAQKVATIDKKFYELINQLELRQAGSGNQAA